MSRPLNNFDTTFESFLQELPEDYRELAIECKAFCRSRKIKTPDQLMRVVLCYCGVDQVLRETAGSCTLLEERISDTAIHRRLKACGPWVKAMLSRMMGAAAPIEGHLRFVIVDGSTVQGPGAKGTWYRLHVAIDMVKWHLLHVSVTDAHEAERLGRYPLQEGDVVVGDRGYNQARQWIEQADRGVGLVVRDDPQGLNLYDAAGQKMAVHEALNETAATERCLPARVRAKLEFVEGSPHARRLPPAQAAEARRRARARAKKDGRQIRPRTLALAEWVLIFTTLPPTVLPAAAVMALYRVRWQVELVIKRLKSISNIDQLRARKDGLLAGLYLHGKPLYAWVLEKRARQRSGESWNRLDRPRRATPWRVWRPLNRELALVISGACQWGPSRWAASLEVMQERPRRRQLQTLPGRVNRLIAYCQARGISNT